MIALGQKCQPLACPRQQTTGDAMTFYDFLQFAVCVFSILAAGFWLQSATSRLVETGYNSRPARCWYVSTSVNEPVAMECSGSRVCGYGGSIPIGCSSAAICWLKMIQALQEMPDTPNNLENSVHPTYAVGSCEVIRVTRPVC